MNLASADLKGKVVLEVGSGRGDTTRRLVGLLEGKQDAKLIVTDIANTFLDQLRDEFKDRAVKVEFIQTDACELRGVEEGSIDHLVCNYTLCAVNAQAGQLVSALCRFRHVLRVGGQLLIEEELPISDVNSPLQAIWSQKWRLLKSAMLLAGRCPYCELDPEWLESICRSVGFRDVQCSKHRAGLAEQELEFFQRRLERLLPLVPNDEFRAGFLASATSLREQAKQVGGMEIPYYRMTAVK